MINAFVDTFPTNSAANEDFARTRINQIPAFIDLRNKRVLEVGCGHGDICRILAEEYGCHVVGIDVMSHDSWKSKETIPNLSFYEVDIAATPQPFADNSFDLIISFYVWEHVRHPWSALKNCQRMLRPGGAKYIHSYLYGSARASHMYHLKQEPWIHLLYSPNETRAAYELDELHWSYWCNRVTYQQYLFYFRSLGFHVTHEDVFSYSFDQDVYEKNEQILGLYPLFDLKADGFKVVLEFDKFSPKQQIPDPVYRLRK